MKSWMVALGSGGLGLVVGALAASSWRSPPPEAPLDSVVAASPEPRAVAPRVEDDALGECRAQLALLQGLWDAQVTRATGEPVAFPADLPEAFHPAAYESNVIAAIDACPELGLELEFIDCEEYPCIAWLSSPENKALRDCGLWQEIYGTGGGRRSATVFLEEGERQYTTNDQLAELSETKEAEANRDKRSEQRLKRGHERLMDEWGGVELTDEEQKKRDIVFWTSEVEKGNPMAQMILDGLLEP